VVAAKDLTHPPNGAGLTVAQPSRTLTGFHAPPSTLSETPREWHVKRDLFESALVEPGGQRPAGFQHVAFGDRTGALGVVVGDCLAQFVVFVE